jgi:hypothetical protein
VDAFVVVARFRIHKVERQRGFSQSVANIEHIAGCVSQTLKLTFDDIWVNGVIEVAQDHFIGSFAPRLVSMVNYVGLEFFNQPTVKIRGVNVDFDHFVWEPFAVVLLLLKSGRKVIHHILIDGYALYIYWRRLVFPGLLGAGGTCRGGESSSNRFREVNGAKLPAETCRRQMGPLPFLDSLPCPVGRSRRPRAQGPIGLGWGRDRAHTTVRRLGRRQGRRSRAGRRW